MRHNQIDRTIYLQWILFFSRYFPSGASHEHTHPSFARGVNTPNRQHRPQVPPVYTSGRVGAGPKFPGWGFAPPTRRLFYDTSPALLPTYCCRPALFPLNIHTHMHTWVYMYIGDGQKHCTGTRVIRLMASSLNYHLKRPGGSWCMNGSLFSAWCVH